jgi:pre-rRNA-processing protein TSR3
VKEPPGVPIVYVLLLRQDDPRKCTAAKLARFGLARPLYRARQIPRRALVLNPFTAKPVLPADQATAVEYGLVAVDCSWEKIANTFAKNPSAGSRRLPKLLAANPVNYSKAEKLSSAEALAGALYVLGFAEKAQQILSLFKWGPTFFTLNNELLASYSEAKTATEMVSKESEFDLGFSRLHGV